MELEGALFFGTGETLAIAIDAAVGQGARWVVLDLRRLTEIDSTGAHVLVELKADLAQRNVKLWLAAARKTIAMERMEEFGALAPVWACRKVSGHRSRHAARRRRVPPRRGSHGDLGI
jgi:MFS superfamily sulfate permease-like transporter